MNDNQQPYELPPLESVLSAALEIVWRSVQRQQERCHSLQNDYRFGWQQRGKKARLDLYDAATVLEALEAWKAALL